MLRVTGAVGITPEFLGAMAMVSGAGMDGTTMVSEARVSGVGPEIFGKTAVVLEVGTKGTGPGFFSLGGVGKHRQGGAGALQTVDH